jgi:UDP-N-acetylglucosamine diphosphorylase/glucosamine-1-phosphate N-acetyltransferase
VLPEGTVIANARCIPALSARKANADVWRVAGRVAAVRLPTPADAATLADGSFALESIARSATEPADVIGRWLDAVSDLVAFQPQQLEEDAARIAATTTGLGTPGERIGDYPVIVELGAHVDPYVVFDATAGAVVVQRGARIDAFSRITGPCVIGPSTHILGGRITGSAIGEHCKIHGDVSASVFLGHANKAHEGFLGHSIVGRWANLGAGTTTSNLKNSYGSVKLWTPAGERDTGLTFLGSLIGDHAKLGIGTMLGTGTVVGAGANVFGTVRPPKRVPAFAWGDAPPYETFSLEKFLEVAARVMERRSVKLDAGTIQLLKLAHSLAGTSEW